VIPRIIHHIWLGGSPSPQLQTWMGSWTHHHPEWEHRVWTDDNLPTLRNDKEFRAAPSLAQKADVLRYELLLEHGGLYVDTDFECYRSLDERLTGPTLVMASEYGCLTNSIMAGDAGHPYLQALVDELPERLATSGDSVLPHVSSGPSFVDKVFCDMGLAFDPDVLLLPSDYFFPAWTFVKHLKEQSSQKLYARHHEMATWRESSGARDLWYRMKVGARVRRFLDLTHP
jgi:hypothetical protein